MQRKTLMLAACAAALVVGLCGTNDVFADKKIEGTYSLDRWGFGSNLDVKIWIQKTGDGEDDYKVTRIAEYSDGTKTAHTSSKVWFTSSGWMRVDFAEKASLIDNLNGGGQARVVAKAIYKVDDNGRVRGLFRGLDENNEVYDVYERGTRGADEPLPGDDTDGDDTDTDGDDTDTDGDDTDNDPATPTISAPESGTVLSGQTLALTVEPTDAEVTITGPAKKVDTGLELTGPGTVTLVAKKGDEESSTVTLEVVRPEVTEVTVLDALTIEDASAPHFNRDLGGDEGTITPAALLMGQKLRLQVTLKATENLTRSAAIRVTATDGDVTLSGEANVRNLSSGSRITLETEGPLAEAVKINDLDLTVKIGEEELEDSVELRVYTSFKSPIKNVQRDVRAPNTKLHFEKAVKWANGASQNIGNGDDSIGWNVDNRMRHFVHHKDWGPKVDPLVRDYAADAEVPLNYDDIWGWVNRQTGERRISSLYYPPLEPKEDYEEYENYRNNYGWWVLDNPRYTGGRCNQQAALVCGILGTLGIEGEILYLHRYGYGKDSGRPVRQYFYSNDSWPAQSDTGGGPWNFHGVAMVKMDDGSYWIYDGSFSSPPNRKNGTRVWAENAGGPFVHSWGPWLYDDAQGGRVPASDIPATFYGIQKKDGEE